MAAATRYPRPPPARFSAGLGALLAAWAFAQPPAEPTWGIALTQASGPDGAVLVADNAYFGPVQIAVYRKGRDGEPGGRLIRGLRVLPPRSETVLWRLPDGDTTADYFFQHIPGDPVSSHEPPGPYRLPYASGSHHLVSQVYPDRITHGDRSSEYAIDFEMPIGTAVHAARAGVVMEVAGDYFGADPDPSAGTRPANLVRILHDDGTMALYAHLQWHSIRVAPGDRVARGQWLANSGNTGFSTGPHLHFAVQRNRGGFVVSVPVEFEGRDGPVTLQSGDEPIAD